MIAVITILYVAVIVLVFKIFKVPPRPWPIALFVTAGVLMIGAIVVFWTLAAPISEKAVVSRHVVQIVPRVKGKVLSIPAKPNVPLRKDKDILFQIDPAPYQYDLNLAQVQLQAAKSNVEVSQAAVNVATANVVKAKADVAETQFAYEADLSLQRQGQGAVSELKVAEDKAQYLVAVASVEQATASVNQAENALQAAKDAVTSTQAQVETAKFNLSQCTVTAPADGFVTDWQIREGTMVSPVAASAAGTFIDTSDTFIAASYPAEELIHVKPGEHVELAFKSRPGRLFYGTVEDILEATGEGQFAPGGKLPSASQIGSPGYFAVKIRLRAYPKTAACFKAM